MSSRPKAEIHQLELNLAAEATDRSPEAGSAPRICPVCGVALGDRRRDALYCGGPCRAEASRLRRLRMGRVVDGYRNVAAYKARQRRTESDGGQ